MYYGMLNCTSEWSFASHTLYPEPDALELDVVFTDPDGESLRVPAFWGGEQTWRVRFAPAKEGLYRYCTVCADEQNGDLHGQEGRLCVQPYSGSNPLLRHGPLRVAADQRHFEHRDGTTFLWLGDTWWMGLCSRWRWPEDFQRAAADRHDKGFSVVQIVAGLYPDMPAYDPRSANEAGLAWEADWGRINPAYFDMADLRIQWLNHKGIVPCIVGGWGYYLPWLGLDKMKRHWRYLVARWGAYPVLWCLAGEVTMPYYQSPDRDGDAHTLRAGWSEIARYVRALDPYHHPVSVHTGLTGHFENDSRLQLDDPSLVDFCLMQGGNSGYWAQADTVRWIAASWAREPRMPVVQGESVYENNQSSNGPEIQRFTFWSSMLSGVGGYTYGADGIWQINSNEAPYGASPTGVAWGDTPWEEALQAAGGKQIALGKSALAKLLLKKDLQGSLLEPHQEWVQPAANTEQWFAPYAAGIPGKLRVVYFPHFHLHPWADMRVKGLEPGVIYQARFLDPRNGQEFPTGTVQADERGEWRVAVPLTMHDWVLILEA
jgi:hypothetical protein